MNRKIAGLAVVMACCIVVVACLCSFTLPDYGTTPIYVENVTQTDAQNVMAIVDFQAKTGQFNNLLPVVGYMNNAKTELWLLLVNPEISYTLEYTSYNFTLKNNTENPSLYYRYRFYLKTGGFSTGAPETNYDSGNGFSTYTALNPIFVRPTPTSDLQINTLFAFKTGVPDNDDLRDIAVEWYEFYDRNVNFDEKISEAESEGYAGGFNQGYADGLDQGFADGLEEGESRGYESGYDNGYSSGYRQGEFDGLSSGYEFGYNEGESVGYESGYDRGYSEGYIDGYDTGKAEGGGDVTIYDPSFELDIPEIFDGMFAGVGGVLSAFDIELFGINIIGVLLSLLIIAIVAFIVRRLMK